MSPLKLQLYRFSFWLAPTTALSFWYGASTALREPALHWMTWWPLLVSYGIVPVLDLLAGRVVTQFSAAEQTRLARDRMLRVIPWLLCAELACHARLGAGDRAAGEGLPWTSVLGFVVSLGIVGGILAINVGHELIHRNNRLERMLGGVLLASVCYGVFRWSMCAGIICGWRLPMTRQRRGAVSRPMASCCVRLRAPTARLAPRTRPAGTRRANRLGRAGG